MKRSQYLMVPMVALGLSTGCLDKETKIKPKPDAAVVVVGVKTLEPGTDCAHGGMAITFSNKKVDKQCKPAPEADKPAVGPTWTADLHVLEENAPGVAHASQVSKVTGNVHYDLAGVETPHMPLLEEVGGDLIIGSKTADDAASNGILNLSGLARLRCIGGSLIVRGNAKLTDLSGLAALEKVGQILIENNGALITFNLPPKVKMVNAMEISGNKVLNAVAGDNALTRVAEGLTIEGNPELVNLDAFARVQEVKTLTIADNAKLPTVGGFAGLNKVAESLEVRNNAALANVSGFQALQEVGIELEVRGNAALGAEKDAAVGFPALKKVHALRFIDNKSMHTLGNFTQFAEANEFSVHGNSKLGKIEMPALRGVEHLQIGKTAVNKQNKEPSGNTEGTMNQKLITHYEYEFTQAPKA